MSGRWREDPLYWYYKANKDLSKHAKGHYGRKKELLMDKIGGWIPVFDRIALEALHIEQSDTLGDSSSSQYVSSIDRPREVRRLPLSLDSSIPRHYLTNKSSCMSPTVSMSPLYKIKRL